MEELNIMKEYSAQIDVRPLSPKDKHPRIFETFDGLKEGETMELINDHDPKPLQYQFLAERANEFEWEYLEEGPDVWRVAISKK